MTLWIKAASTDSLLDLSDEIHGFLCLVTKQTDTHRATAQLERRLFLVSSQAWKAAADKALRESSKHLAGRPTRTKIRRFLKAMGVKLDKPLTASQEKEIGRRLTDIWRRSKQIASKEVKVAFQFGRPDFQAVRALRRHHVFWIGDFYDAHLSARIAAVAEDGLIMQGLSQREVGAALRQELLSNQGATKLAEKVPARYAGRQELYFRQLASNAAHQARTFSRIETFRSAGIRRYRLDNPMDNRTGQVCQQMHGQEFGVEQGVDRMNAILGATTSAEIKAAAPWLTPKQVSTELGQKTPGSASATAALANAKMELPPYHPLCRTEPIAIS